MSKHTIIGCFGEDDRPDFPVEQNEKLTRLNFIDPQGRLEHGIEKVLSDMIEAGITPTEIGRDFLFLGAGIYAADTRISRTSESQDNWTREIRLVVPVSDPDRWNQSASILTRMTNFLTGDKWEFCFRAYPDGFQFPTFTKKAEGEIIHFDKVSLFSGGLDSLVGAIDQLELRNNPVFVSHASEGASSKAQTACFTALSNNYQNQSLRRVRFWLNFPKDLVREVGPEDSTRGRSFLFLALGICVGTGSEGPFTLFVPENGLISLNVPLDPLRLGALSTRTTHPFFLKSWNSLIQTLNIQGQILNPYWNKTKGEMLAECTNQILLRQIVGLAMSCSSTAKSRWLGHSQEHCGYCVPCVIRRASILAAFGAGNDPTTYTISDLEAEVLNSKTAKGVQIRSFQVAIRRLAKNPDLARVLILKPGPLEGDSRYIGELASVYQRGMAEVKTLLENVVTEPLA